MAYTNSPLVSYTKLSPNHSGQRTHSIDRITPHCVVGQCSVETLGNIFLPTSRQASSNYGIGVDGRVGMYVEEKNRSWCSSSNANDQRAVTIECASDIMTASGKGGAGIGIGQVAGQTGAYRPKIKLPVEGAYVVGAAAGGAGVGTELAVNSAIEFFDNYCK